MATLMDKHFNVRIKLRNDSWTNWEEKKDFIPYDGEVIIYDIPTQEEVRTYGLGSLNYQLIKIGDGVKTLKQLPAINEMSTTLNIEMGSKKGTISVAGTDIYVNGLNNNNIMCFELKSSYATSSGLSSLRNQFNDRISSVQGDLRSQINTLENDLNNVESKLNNITGDSFSKIDILESELEQEKILRTEGDQLNQQSINNLQILMNNNDEEIESTIRNNHNTVTRLIEDETKARLDQIQSVKENISNIVNRLDILEESNEGSTTGKLLIQQIDNNYDFYQDNIKIGSIIIPEDNYVINGQIIRENNTATIQLYTKEEDPILIDATNLIDIYRAQELAEKIQLSINSNNVISASIIDKSLTNVQIANGTILEENLSSELVAKINSSSGGGTSSLPEEQFESLKQYIDESVNIETGVISGQYGANDITTLEYGSYFNVPSFNVNAQGKITQANTNQLKLPSFLASTGETNGTVLINDKEIAVKGLGTAAYSDASDYDIAGSAATSLTNAKLYTDTALNTAKAYTDNAKASLKDELLGGAGEAYDTLQELNTLISSNTTALQALNTVAAGKADKEHTHQYAGSSTIGGAAISANKINTDAGSLEQPVYFNNGIPVPITYTIKSNVPANAKFTDTTYSEATASNAGLMSAAMYSKLNGITAGAAVTSVNSKTGAVSLTYTDVGAAASSHTHSEYSVTTHTHNYLPLSGGTLTGNLFLAGNEFAVTENTYPGMYIKNASGTTLGRIYVSSENGEAGPLYLRTTDSSGSHQHAYLALDGGWHANSVWGAVYNDYAEFRSQNEEIKPGYVTYCDDDGKLKITTKHLQKFEGVVSDTFGFSIGQTNENKTPLAVSGRVLVYGNPEEHFHSGDCVCAGPNGFVYKMTREEIIKFPDRIVGIVSEIPTYEIWGTSNIKVDGRIWIKVR